MSSGWEMSEVSDGGLWDTVVGCTNTVGSARSGARGLRVNAAFTFVQKQVKLSGNTDSAYGRLAVDVITSATGRFYLVQIQDAGIGTNVFSIVLNTDDTLELWKGGATPAQLGSDSPAITAYDVITWSYVQTTLTATAYLNGVQFATGTVDSTSDNATSVSAGIYPFEAPFNQTAELHFDDFAWNDQLGTVETGLPSVNGHIIMCLPDSSGDNAMGSRGGADSGTDHGQVNENPPNDATNYYILDADNDILDVNLTSASVWLPGGETIPVVHVCSKIRAESASGMSYKQRWKTQAAGTVYDGAVTKTWATITWKANGDAGFHKPLTGYSDPQGGGVITGALLDSSQIGIIATDATPDCWITSLWLLFEYVDAAGAVMINPAAVQLDSPLGVNRGLVRV